MRAIKSLILSECIEKNVCVNRNFIPLIGFVSKLKKSIIYLKINDKRASLAIYEMEFAMGDCFRLYHLMRCTFSVIIAIKFLITLHINWWAFSMVWFEMHCSMLKSTFPNGFKKASNKNTLTLIQFKPGITVDSIRYAMSNRKNSTKSSCICVLQLFALHPMLHIHWGIQTSHTKSP